MRATRVRLSYRIPEEVLVGMPGYYWSNAVPALRTAGALEVKLYRDAQGVDWLTGDFLAEEAEARRAFGVVIDRFENPFTPALENGRWHVKDQVYGVFERGPSFATYEEALAKSLHLNERWFKLDPKLRLMAGLGQP